MSEELKIAKNNDTPAEKLRELSKTKDREILAAIAQNPNTPPDLLIELAGEYLDEIGFNPALDLILLENHNFIAEICYKHFADGETGEIIIFLPTKLPNWFLKLGLDNSDFNIRIAIAWHISLNIDIPLNYLEKLATDESPLVRYTITNNPKINAKIIKLLFEDRNYNPNPNDYQEIRNAIELEIKRLDWTEERARKYLQEKYGQRGISDLNLSNEQLFEFWRYLKSIESNNYPTSLKEDIFNSLDDIPF